MRSLLPLRVEGQASRDIEALPSYLSRLAAAHGVSPGGLFNYLLNGYEGGSALAAALDAQPFAAIARPNTTAESAIRILSQGKCESSTQLRQCTFLHLTPALARSPGAYSKRMSWCPGCLYEQRITHGTAYLKLAWFLEAVQVCDIHRVSLRTQCPYCGVAPSPRRGWPSFGVCPKCGGRLDVVHASDRVVLDPEPTAPDLLALVEQLARRDTPFPPGATNRYVDRLFDESWANGRELELWRKLPRDECLRYSALDEPVILPIVRRIAYRLEIPIAELLGANRPAVHSFGFAAEASLPPPMRFGRRGRVIDRVALASRLKAVVEGASEPQSLRDVARHLGVSVGAIRYHCPGLLALLVDRCQTFNKAEQARKQLAVQTAVAESFSTWHETQTAPIAKKSLLALLMKRTGLPKEALRQAINQRWSMQSTPAKRND